MKKIHNGYSEMANYNCFGCAAHNPIGLKLEFFEDNEYVVSKWIPSNNYEGYHNILHGGIQATLMDEIANWVIINKLKQTGVTKSLQVNYAKSVYIDKGEITISAKVSSIQKRDVTIYAEIKDCDGLMRSSALICYTLIPGVVAIIRNQFPGYDQFYLEE
ncbi:MAG: PaaI family thioesterase [Bacteroidota bacterium]